MAGKARLLFRRNLPALAIGLLSLGLLTILIPPSVSDPVVACGPLQPRVDAAPLGSNLDLSACIFSSGATISKSLTLVGGTLNVPSGTAGLTVTANNVTIDGLQIVGSNKTSYDPNEYGILAVGTPGAPIRSLTIRNANIGSFGNAAVFAKYVANLTVSGSAIHDTVYGGVIVISGSGGTISTNLVQRIGVNGSAANENNAYGVLLTDQGGTPSSDISVNANTVEDVPTWHALDTHGGVRLSFTNNTVRRSSRALFITGSPAGHATDVTVTGNQFLSPNPVTFNIEAVTTVGTANVRITGNTISGWDGSTIEDYGSESTGLVISGNAIGP
jgi:hypothetical protein